MPRLSNGQSAFLFQKMYRLSKVLSVIYIGRQCLSMELVWPYVKSHSDLSVEGYLVWAKEQQDSIYQIKYEQHQGLDAIMEEVNKTLKTLIPPIPQHRHWKIAARNCKKFLEVLLIFQLKLVNNIYIKLIYDRI